MDILHSSAFRASIMSLVGVLVLLGPSALRGQTRDYDSARPFGTLREQAEVQQAWLEERLETNLPMLMRKHRIDMWVLAMREYN
jgi:hypothetical protein